MPDLQQNLRNRPWILPALLFVILSTATLFAWQHLREIENTSLTEELNRSSATYTNDIYERLKLHAQFLRSVQSFASTHQPMSEQAWTTFSREVKAFDHLPGMYAFAYAPALKAEDKASFTLHMRQRLNNDHFKIYPLTQKDLSLPVSQVSPPDERMKSVLGFDLITEPIRRQAIFNARDSREVALSGRITIVNDEKKSPGFMLIKTIYHNNMPLSTVAERERALSGVVLAAYRVDEFLAPLTRNIDHRFILQVFDDGDSERSAEIQPQLLFSSDPDWIPGNGTTPLHHEIQFGDRNWIIHIYPRLSDQHNSVSNPQLILVSGVLLSLLLSLLVFHQTTHRQRAENYAEQLTARLRKSEERFRLAAEGSQDGLWDQNLLTGEDYLSTRLGEIFGYAPAEMPHYVSDYEKRILPEDETRRRSCLREHLRGNSPYDVEVRIHKVDGSLAWIRIRGQAQQDAAGQSVRLAGTVTDVTQLHLAEEELLTHRDALQVLVDERTERLEKALRQANQANQAKSEFLANMSHELRTPMHAILSFASLGQNKAQAVQDAKLKQYFDRISQSAERLLTLINDLLDLSKLESGAHALQPVTVDLHTMIKMVRAQQEASLQSKHLKLLIDTGDTGDQEVMADRLRIEQIISNLLSNAIKFSPEGGVITVLFKTAALPQGRRANDTGSKPALQMLIIDNGPGIPANELEAVFEKFYQSTLTKTGAGGTGLGLAICRENVLQHHGTICASNNLSGGATFTVTLPRTHSSESIKS